jgi:integrase/recombinase XerD
MVEKRNITLSEAVEGYLLAANARRLSLCTIAEYTYTFRALQAFLARDVAMREISPGDIRGFLNSRDGRSAKTLLNNHVGLSALWRWAMSEGIVPSNVVREVQAPKPERREVVPYSLTDVRAMLGACDRTRAYSRPGKARCDNERRTALRDRALILLLLDTGIRASELCGLKIFQADLRNHRVVVRGKGARERMVPFSPRTGQAIWRYLAQRGEERTAQPLFVSWDGQGMTRDGLRRVLQRIGERGGVRGVTVHRFRHTFAIEFLRNHPNAFALQRMLGHSSLEMVRRYLAIAEADVETAHESGSPVAKWVL